MDFIKLLLALINSMSVVIVTAYVLTRSKLFSRVIEKKLTLQDKFLLVFIFGAFSIYGTLGGIEILGAIANIRDLGPAIAGMVAGPVVGLGAGIIGAIHRYFQGGFTATACSVATIFAGLAGGIVYKLKKGEFISVGAAVLLAVSIEIVHFGFTLMLSRPFDQAVDLLKKIMLPMFLANGAGMGVFTFIVVNLLKERATEKAKRLIESELEVAREIQMSIVPKIFPPFPNRKEFEIYAALEPAKEVGGDLYDFFFIDDFRIFFVIGDVSGKGVPASLFMAVTKTVLKAKTSKDAGPEEILRRANNELCQGNDSGMFVTVFCGIMDTRTGQVDYSNAGHNPPFIVYRDGSVERLFVKGGVALGAMEDMVYARGTLKLNGSDMLVLYTDGVTEAVNNKLAFFTEQGLIDSLKGTAELSVKEVAEKIINNVHGFAENMPQADDITVMTLRYLG